MRPTRCECVPLSSTYSLLRSKPTLLELLDHVVLCVAARWYHFGLALGVEDYLLEDIKATERSEVQARCTDMLKCWLRGERATGGEECSWSTVLGSVQRCLGREAAWSIAGPLQADSELSCAECGSSQQVEVQGIGSSYCCPSHQVSLSLFLRPHPLP